MKADLIAAGLAGVWNPSLSETELRTTQRLSIANTRGYTVESVSILPIRKMMIIRLVAAFSLAAGIIAGTAGTAMSAIDISGVYIGNFTSTCGNGTFALLVSSNHSAVLLAFSINQSDRSVDQREDLAVDPDGSLRFSGFLGRSASVQATFARRAVDGTITGACDGEITGARAATRGFMENAGGYYVGVHNGTIEQEECVAFSFLFCVATAFEFVGTYSGPIFTIVAANGLGYVLFKSPDTSLALNAGGEISVTPGLDIDCVPDDPSLTKCDLDGSAFETECTISGVTTPCVVSATGQISGGFSVDTLKASGTLNLSETKFGNFGFGLTRLETRKRGPFTMTRQRPLPPPELTSLPWLKLLLLDD